MIENSERHAAYDAPSREQFGRLYAATFENSDDYETQLEDRFITVASGRLTLRRGELLHFNRDWLDRDTKLIKIPHHEPCACSYCVDRAENYAEDRDMTAEDALALCWGPKTEAGVRAIYYGCSPRAIDAVERFADVVGTLDMDVSTINRRVDKLADRAGIRQNVYPHALRASAGFWWADLGLEAAYLQAIMGWRSIEVAVAYLRASGIQLAQRIERAFAVGNIERPDPVPAEDLLPPADETANQPTDAAPTAPGATSLWNWPESAN